MTVRELSLVIPAYNEEKRIVPVVKNYLSFLRKKRLDFEIIIACNNCSDSTPEIVSRMAKGNDGLVFVNFPFYTGKGGAVFEGFKIAKKSVVGFVDADESTSPEEFFKIFSEIGNGFDAAIGSRTIPGSVIARSQPFYRVFVAKLFSFLVNAMFGLEIIDTQCGAKVFKKSLVEKVVPLVKSNGWEFDVELLWRIKQSGSLIKQVPIVWRDAEYSRFNFSATPKMFFALLKRRFGI